MSTNTAIVDERDPLVSYTGSWNNAGTPAEFQGTTRWSATQDSTASFTFTGTSITVYGSVAVVNPPLASLSFSIDGSAAGTYTPANTASQHHQPLWTSPALSSGSHTLLITQTQAQPLEVISIDYLMYQTTSTAVDSYFIDDRDSRITYSSDWHQFEGDEDFQHTSQRTGAAGDSFSLQFDGTSVLYYGGATGQPISASIVLDGAPPMLFSPPSGSLQTTNNLIFSSGDLSDGGHTLVVTAENGNPVWVDYFLVHPGAGFSSTTSSTSSATTTSITTPISGPSNPSNPSSAGAASNVPSNLSSSTTSSTSTATLTHSSGAATSNLSSAQSNSSSTSSPIFIKSTPIGTIIGGVVGGLLLVGLILAALLMLRRRKRWVQSADLAMTAVPMPPASSAHAFSSSGFSYAPIAASQSTTALVSQGLQNTPWSEAAPMSNKLAREMGARRITPQPLEPISGVSSGPTSPSIDVRRLNPQAAETLSEDSSSVLSPSDAPPPTYSE